MSGENSRGKSEENGKNREQNYLMRNEAFVVSKED